MKIALYIAAVLTAILGILHSYLGERYILLRLARRPDLLQLFGGSAITVRTLRFAWHVTSVAWWGFAAILVLLAQPPVSIQALGVAVGATFLCTGGAILVASRGRHLAWPVFLIIGGIALFATGA